MNMNHRVRTVGKGKRLPHSVRLHDLEWNRIKDSAKACGLVPSEFVRHAALAAVTGGQVARLAPLIEATFRATHILVSRLREEMLGTDEQDELDAMIAAARALQAKLLDEAFD